MASTGNITYNITTSNTPSSWLTYSTGGDPVHGSIAPPSTSHKSIKYTYANHFGHTDRKATISLTVNGEQKTDNNTQILTQSGRSQFYTYSSWGAVNGTLSGSTFTFANDAQNAYIYVYFTTNAYAYNNSNDTPQITFPDNLTYGAYFDEGNITATIYNNDTSHTLASTDPVILTENNICNSTILNNIAVPTSFTYNTSNTCTFTYFTAYNAAYVCIKFDVSQITAPSGDPHTISGFSVIGKSFTITRTGTTKDATISLAPSSTAASATGTVYAYVSSNFTGEYTVTIS